MGVVAITGSAGGIGRALHKRLEDDGHRVVGVDITGAEVVADLSTADGRRGMVEDVAAACDGALDGVVAGAGIMGEPGSTVVSINYFGAVATLEALRPLLIPGGSAVAISSNSCTTQPGIPAALVDACLEGDEERARELADQHGGTTSYGSSKLALARWVRRQAAEWAGAGLRLNAVAPGFVRTPMTAGHEDFIFSLGDVYPIPVGRAAEPEEVAALIALLLSDEGRFFAGSVIFVDGGSDAAVRADDWPSARP
jgi:NAD(P)-dependent dehydrogenase (short-subunit alcohol dehydrogenase family)